MSPFQLHVNKWKDCTKCALHHCRDKVVIGRGSIPCDVLFVGEAPGISENSIGKPFCGPAGKVLDGMVKVAMEEKNLRCYFTNLVCCIPLNEAGTKNVEPDEVEIMACSGRLHELIKLCKPRLIVCVGDIAWTWLGRGWATEKILCDITKILHPSAILKLPPNSKARLEGFLVQQNVEILREAFRSI